MKDNDCIALYKMSCFKEGASVLFLYSAFVIFISVNTVFSIEKKHFCLSLKGKSSDS